VIAAFAVAVVAAVALISVAVLAGRDGGGPAASTAPALDLSGIPQSGTLLGDAGASVVLIEYADLQCPFCAAYSTAVLPTIVDEYVRPGKVRAELRGLAFLGPDSEKALRFVLAAGLQNHAWELQEALYRNQGAENSGWVTDDLVRELAVEIQGLDVDRLFEDASSSEVTAQIEKAAQQGQADQVPGTPSFFVKIGAADPYRIEVPLDPDAFRAALDDALQG
jgi:protein-disulfide isomerase